MRALLALALAGLVAGCASPGAPSQRLACFPQAEARWEEPGTFARLVEKGSVLVDELPASLTPDPLPFGQHGAVEMLRWSTPRGIVTYAGVRDPTLEVVATPGAPDAEVGAVVADFYARLGLDTPPHALADLAKNRTGGSSFFAGVPFAPSTRFLPEIDPVFATPPQTAYHDVGGIAYAWPEWTAGVRIPAGVRDADGLRLAVDEQDHVRATARLAEGELAWPALMAKTNATFATLGLPAPTFAHATGGGGRACEPAPDDGTRTVAIRVGA